MAAGVPGKDTEDTVAVEDGTLADETLAADEALADAVARTIGNRNGKTGEEVAPQAPDPGKVLSGKGRV